MYISVDKANIKDINVMLSSPSELEKQNSPNDYEDILNGLYSVRHLGWNLVPYQEGGLYDRISQSLKDHKDDIEMPDQERYDWFQISFSWRLAMQVCLMKPGCTSVGVKFFNKDGKQYFKYTNYVKLNMKWYYSINEECNAITFADSANIIKPMKILAHDWADYSTPKLVSSFDILDSWDRKNHNRVCRKCGLFGENLSYNAIEHPSMKYVTMPEKLLTCDEYMIDDILT